MRIALAQMACRSGDVAANTRAIIERIRAAAAGGASLVVLPEMADTGYHMPTILRTASTWEHGPFAEVSAAAADSQIHVVVGLSERVGPDIYNTAAVIGPDGSLLTKYRKSHLITAEPVCEQNYLRPGDSLTICDIAGFKSGLMICYDIRFPELARKLVLNGAELLIVPAAFPRLRIGHWDAILTCRAIENQAYVAAVNRCGVDEGLAFGGSSRVIDPAGEVLASANTEDESLLFAEITRERLAEVRRGLQVFADRRDDLYR
jgi:predicted amidohydrolase